MVRRSERTALEKLRRASSTAALTSAPTPDPRRPRAPRAPPPPSPIVMFEQLTLASFLTGVDCIHHGGDPGAWAADLDLPPIAGNALAWAVRRLKHAQGMHRFSEQYGQLVPGLAPALERTFARLKRHFAGMSEIQREALKMFTKEISTLDDCGTWSAGAIDGLRIALKGGVDLTNVSSRPRADGRSALEWTNGSGIPFGLFWHWPMIGAVLHARALHRMKRATAGVVPPPTKHPPDLARRSTP